MGVRSGSTASTESRPSRGRGVEAAHTRSVPLAATSSSARVREAGSASPLTSESATPSRPARKPSPQSGEALWPPSTTTLDAPSAVATRSPASRVEATSVGTRTNEAWEREAATASSKVGPAPNGRSAGSASAQPARTPWLISPNATPVGKRGRAPSHRPATTTRLTGRPGGSAAAPRRGSRPSDPGSTATRPRSARSSADPQHP